MNKYEKLIDLINEGEDAKAKELFHEIVVESSRKIYESFMDEEMGGDESDDLMHDVSADEEGMSEDDDMDMDYDEGDEDYDDVADDEADVNYDQSDEEEDVEDLEDRVVDLEDQIDELVAKFEDLMGDEEREDDDISDLEGDEFGDEDEDFDSDEDEDEDFGSEDEDKMEGLGESRRNKRRISEKWANSKGTNPEKRGMFAGRSEASLKKELKKINKSGPHKRGSAQDTKRKELQFALRSKHGWGKVPESEDLDENVSLSKVTKGISDSTEEAFVNKKSANNNNSGAAGMKAKPQQSHGEETGRKAPEYKDLGSTTEPRVSRVSEPKRKGEDSSINKNSIIK